MSDTTIDQNVPEGQGGSSKKPVIAGVVLFLAVALFFGGFFVGYHQVTELEDTLASERAEWESARGELESERDAANEAKAQSDVRVSMLIARQRLAQAARAVGQDNYGLAREHLADAHERLEAGPQPFEALAAQVSSIDIQVGGDLDASVVAIHGLAETLDAALDAE